MACSRSRALLTSISTKLSERAVALSLDVVVGEYADRVAFEIIILTALERPKKGRQSGKAEQERQRNQVDQDVHDTNSGAVPPCVALSAATGAGERAAG